MNSKLSAAAGKGKLDQVQKLLKTGADPNAPGPQGVPPLYVAALYNHTSVVQALLAAGADVNHSNHVGYTPLMAASRGGHAAVIKILIEAGADLKASANRGMTALVFACQYGSADAVQCLLEHGADISVIASGSPVICWAVYNPDAAEAIVRLLLARGADAAQRDGSGRNARDHAEKRNPALLPLLQQAQSRP